MPTIFSGLTPQGGGKKERLLGTRLFTAFKTSFRNTYEWL